MCRLYAMHANEPTRVECSLVKAQNALMRQSRRDADNLTHGHGWGVADYKDGYPIVEKQTWAAFHGEHFEKAAARVYAHTVVAHVRRATVGGTAKENTHPFEHGRWIFAHNGTIPNFLKVRDRMMPHIDPLLQNDIKGTTDSEHIFYFLRSLQMERPDEPLRQLLGQALTRIKQWSRDIDPDAKLGLNVIMTDGHELAGSRFGRTLWSLVRNGLHVCEICGRTHVHHSSDRNYKAIEIASEPLTDETWQALPDEVVFSVGEDFALSVTPLNADRGVVVNRLA
jgi:predicted glutamine amidotransferase